MDSLILYGVQGIPLVNDGDDVAELIFSALSSHVPVENDDVIVVAQKIVSKSEGAVVDISTITPSDRAKEIASQTGRDPRLCQLYLDEASEVIAIKGRMVITRHKLGYVGSSSGIDRSNVAPHDDGRLVLLPKDPDGSARKIRSRFFQLTGKKVAVIINDSCGRDYREGSVGMSIGIAGIGHLEIEEKSDLFGNVSRSQIALVDELAAAASILMGQADESVPAVLIRGVQYVSVEDACIAPLLK